MTSGARNRREAIRQLADLRHRLAGAEETLADALAAMKWAEGAFDAANDRFDAAERVLDEAREDRAQARRDRYAARQAHERASATADRLARWVRELSDRLDELNEHCAPAGSAPKEIRRPWGDPSVPLGAVESWRVPTEASERGGCEQMKRVLFAIALVAGILAPAGSAAAASTSIPKVYPGKNGLIAFVRANQIYTIRPSGLGLKKLTSSGKNYGPVWNPAGTEIAYEHEAPAGVRNIWVMNANGSNKRQWTTTGKTWGEPAWSPSGKQLLISNGGQWGTLQTTSGITPRQPRHALYGYNQDDNNNYTVLKGHNPAWTTGNIAFTASPFYAAADTCAPTGGSSFMGETCIDIYNTTNKVFTMARIPGGGNIQATQCPGYGGASNLAQVEWGRWAPDGSDLLHQYQTWNQDCTASPTKISALYSNVVSQPGDAAADYSPDGARIALTSTLPGQKGNIIIESNTGANRRTLTQGYEPTWQPLPG